MASSAADTNEQMIAAKSVIGRAISIGAPAYNAGNIEECANVYQAAAVEVVDLLPDPLKDDLTSTISSSQNQDNEDRAWAFRRQFDSIMYYQVPYKPVHGQSMYKLEPFTGNMLPVQPTIVNDNVMGGISQGEWDDTTSTFSGIASLANNGGFASVRWRLGNIQNWSYAQGIYMKVVHSSPKRHTFRLLVKDTLCEQVRLANFKTVFANPGNNEDGVIFIPFSAFHEMEQMGRPLSGPSFNRGEVTELGIMAIKPSVVGDFYVKILEWGLYTT